MQLSMAELETALSLNEQIATCSDFETFNSVALPKVTRFLNADSALVMRAPASFERRHKSEVMALENIQRNHIDIYIEEFCDLDPYIEYSMEILANGADGAGDRLFKKSDCYEFDKSKAEIFDREFLRYTGIQDVICFPAAKEARTGDNVVFGLHRHSENGEFNSRTFNKARILFPVVSSVLARCALNHSLSIMERLSLIDDEQDQQMALIFDECGRLVGSSERFSEMSIDVSDMLIEQIQARIASIRISDEQSDVFEFSPEHQTHLESERCVSLDVLVSSGSAHGDRPYYLATIRQTRTSRVRKAAALWSLTARETEIVCALFDGRDNKSIASELGISPKTVENHMTSIFSKTETRSRTELISKVHQ